MTNVSLFFPGASTERALLCPPSGLNFGIGLNYDIYRFDRIDSTNRYLLGLGEKGFPEGTVAVADEQTAGRGRFGRRWEGEPLSSLLFSVLLRPVFLKRDEIFIITFGAGLAVAEALEKVARVKPELKWPNDVLLDGKKVCGILLESNFEGDNLKSLVLGAGLNVNQPDFPAELKEKATSLFLATQRKFDREELFSGILTQFSLVYETLKAGDLYSVMRRWRERSAMFGKTVELSIGDRKVRGILDQVTDEGEVLVRTSEGAQRFTAGEISLSGIPSNETGEKK